MASSRTSACYRASLGLSWRQAARGGARWRQNAPDSCSLILASNPSGLGLLQVSANETSSWHHPQQVHAIGHHLASAGAKRREVAPGGARWRLNAPDSCSLILASSPSSLGLLQVKANETSSRHHPEQVHTIGHHLASADAKRREVAPGGARWRQNAPDSC